jgi:predicted ATPase
MGIAEMASSFRLLRATGNLNQPELVPERMPLVVQFSQTTGPSHPRAWVTVVIGRNGVGKSRLLASIANLFDAADRGISRRRDDDLAVSCVTYEVDGHVCELASKGRKLEAKLDGNPHKLKDFPLPTRVIALTTTPFDKFRISKSLQRARGDEAPYEDERYIYRGLRDRTSRASPTAVLYRALEGLFAASTSETSRRLRIADVFKFLGYKPRIQVRYQFPSWKLDLVQRISSRDLDAIAREYEGRALARIIHSNADELHFVAREALDRLDANRSFTLRADFEGYSGDDVFFRQVQILRRADLLRLISAEVERIEDATTLDLRMASSGELGIVTNFLGLASVIQEGSLVFVDEPEISLHPEWQTRYIELLLKIFDGFQGCHFVLATHSPLILSDIDPKNSNVVSLDRDRPSADVGEAFAGQSSDYLLATAFEAPGNNNLYLKQEIIKALRLAANGKVASPRFAKTVDELVALLPHMKSESPVAQLIRQLAAARNFSS